MKCDLVLGDCLKELSKLKDESIDLCLTDPPYSLTSITKRFGKKGSSPAKKGKDGSFSRLSGGFMGKQWDSEFPSVEVWEEIFRVMKHGAFLVFTMTPRQDCLFDCLLTIRNSGFDIGHSGMYWLYMTGFPKAMDCKKSALKAIENKLKEKYKFEKVEWSKFI